MEIIYGGAGCVSLNKPSGVGLGNFDGLHIGHMALINTLIRESAISRLDSMIYTFTKHPENILRKKLFTPLLTTVNKKVELLGETALKYLYFDEFDEMYSRMKPEAFIKEVLIGRLKARLVVAGFNYRFGYRGQGDSALLKEYGKSLGYRVIIVPPIKIDNEVVSSTLIRHYVSKGDMDSVFKLLGRHYSITAKVVSGRRIGSTIGFPTANIHPEDYLILPSYGVYVTRTLIGGKLFDSITNIGINPTFELNKKVSVETHILNFEGNLYDQRIEVFFLAKLRGEKKFKDKDSLVEQIREDICKAREFFDPDEN